MITRTDAWLFLASLVVALVLFIQVVPQDQAQIEREFSAPLELNGLREDLAVVAPPASVQMLATGSPEDLAAFDSRKVSTSVNLDNAEPGEGDFAIQTSMTAGANVKVTPRTPDIRLRIEPREERNMPVELQTAGNLSDQYVFLGASFTPESVTISGPRSAVGRVTSIRGILNLDETRPQGAYPVNLEALDGDLRPVPSVTVDPLRITVSPSIMLAQVNKEVFVNVKFAGSTVEGFEVEGYEATPTKITITGPPEAVSQITALETMPVSLANKGENFATEVQINVPDGVEASASTVRITVRIRRAQ